MGGGCGRPCLPAAGNWIQLPLAAHKGPIEAVGMLLAPAPAPAALHSSAKATRAPCGHRGAEPAATAPRQRNSQCQQRWGDPWGCSPSHLGTAMGTPGSFPQASASAFQIPPSSGPSDDAPRPPRGRLPAAALLPGHSCPFLREDTKLPFCRVGRAMAVATSDRAAGQSPTLLPSCPLSPAAPRAPLQCHIPSTQARGCASFTQASCHKTAGDAGPASLFPNAPLDPHGGRQSVGLMPREGSQPHPSCVPCPTSLSPPAAPGGHLRVGDLGGFLRQAAALSRDQVIVLGHVLV